MRVFWNQLVHCASRIDDYHCQLASQWIGGYHREKWPLSIIDFNKEHSMNVASGVLSELMSAKMDISKERFEMFTNITVRFKLQSIVWVLFLKFNTNYNPCTKDTLSPNLLLDRHRKFSSQLQTKPNFWLNEQFLVKWGIFRQMRKLGFNEEYVVNEEFLVTCVIFD